MADRIQGADERVDRQAEQTRLARAAVLGDREAFSWIVERFGRPVYNLCWRHLRGPEAEDVTQETFIKAFLYIKSFDPARPLLPWLLVIARHLCLDRLRSQPALVPADQLARLPDPGPTSEKIAASREVLVLLGAALERLNEGPREALALFHFEDLTYQQIAEVLSVPLGTVMTWIHRGRAELKKSLVEQETAAGSDSVTREVK